MGTLYLIATPIGNLEDISARALRLLGQVRQIAAEDARQTRKLLTHFDIHTSLNSYYEHNKLDKLERVLVELDQGDVALVSDAGTPGLLLRKPILGAIPNLARLKAAGVEFEFSERVQQLELRADNAAIPPIDQVIDEADQPQIAKLYRLAEINSRSAILEA